VPLGIDGSVVIPVDGALLVDMGGERPTAVDGAADGRVPVVDGAIVIDGAAGARDGAADGPLAVADARDVVSGEAGGARTPKISGGGCSCEVGSGRRTSHALWPALLLGLASLVRRLSRRSPKQGGTK
jgi:MYXO-CTERM domain-containing protein